MKYIALLFSLLLVGVDQLLKYLVIENFQDMATKSIPIIENFLHISYVENRGVAFGFMQGGGTFLVVITALIIILIVALMLFSKVKSKLFIWPLALILGGGLGNLVDRIARGFVVDYIDFRVINFAVFNFADCCVTIGTIAFIFYVIFSETEKEKIVKTNSKRSGNEKISITVSEHVNEKFEKTNKYINVVGEVVPKDVHPIIKSHEDLPEEITHDESSDVEVEVKDE